jgi:hypothetical protein
VRKACAGWARRFARRLRREYEREPPGSLDSRTERARAVDAAARLNAAKMGGRRCGWRW